MGQKGLLCIPERNVLFYYFDVGTDRDFDKASIADFRLVDDPDKARMVTQECPVCRLKNIRKRSCRTCRNSRKRCSKPHAMCLEQCRGCGGKGTVPKACRRRLPSLWGNPLAGPKKLV